MVSHLNSFRYVEMDGEFIETPCGNFEEVPQTLTSTETVAEDPPMKTASLKDARDVIEKGGCANWGQIPDFAHKIDKFGLGFTAEAQRDVRCARIGRPPLCITNPEVNAIEDHDEESEFDSWIYPTTDGGLSNWMEKDFMPISFITQ